MSGERRFGRFEKNLACAGARARGMYARERARSAETYLLLRVEHHVDRLGARAPGLERGARPADVDDTCHDARKSRINAREGRRRNSLGAGSDEPHARAVRGERPRERKNASLSHASANGVTTRARAACVRVMVRARRAGRFKYNRRLSKVSRVARTLKCRSKLASLVCSNLILRKHTKRRRGRTEADRRLRSPEFRRLFFSGDGWSRKFAAFRRENDFCQTRFVWL